jgi:hypothetical protein
VQRLEPKLKFKDIFNSWLWSLSLVLHFTLCTLILFSHELLTFYFLHFHFDFIRQLEDSSERRIALRITNAYIIPNIRYKTQPCLLYPRQAQNVNAN